METGNDFSTIMSRFFPEIVEVTDDSLKDTGLARSPSPVTDKDRFVSVVNKHDVFDEKDQDTLIIKADDIDIESLFPKDTICASSSRNCQETPVIPVLKPGEPYYDSFDIRPQEWWQDQFLKMSQGTSNLDEVVVDIYNKRKDVCPDDMKTFFFHRQVARELVWVSQNEEMPSKWREAISKLCRFLVLLSKTWDQVRQEKKKPVDLEAVQDKHGVKTRRAQIN